MQKCLPVVDLTKRYPEMKFVVDSADIEYVQLKYTNEALADRDFKIVYVSDKRIVGINRRKGDILIFGRDGKVILAFNHKGNGGTDYQYIESVVFDETNQEIFIADNKSKNRCVVYNDKGVFLRQLNFPDKSRINDIYNFDNQTLLVYNAPHPSGLQDVDTNQEMPDGDINQEMPYVFLSKTDGSIVSRLNLSFPKRNSDIRITSKTENGVTMFGFGTFQRNVKFGQNFIIADSSSDTVFLLTQDKMLTPLFVRTPSCFGETQDLEIIMSVHFKTDKYLFFGVEHRDWKKAIEGQRDYNPPHQLVFDLQTGETYTAVRGPISLLIDAPENTLVVKRHSSYNEKEKYELNPLLEIIKY